MAKRLNFDEFYANPATVYAVTQTTDDMMGPVDDEPSVKTSVGSNGVIRGNLQAWTGGEVVAAGRNSAQINYAYFPDDVYDLDPGDFLEIAGREYEVVWHEDEGGTGEAPIVYLKRVE